LHITDFSMDRFSLRGKRAIVTGGNTGLGQAFTRDVPLAADAAPLVFQGVLLLFEL
jgi:hypothetical protein